MKTVQAEHRRASQSISAPPTKRQKTANKDQAVWESRGGWEQDYEVSSAFFASARQELESLFVAATVVIPRITEE
jgi:hypothetical protein